MEQDTARRLDRARPFALAGLALCQFRLDACRQQLINELQAVFDHLHQLDDLRDVVHVRIATPLRQSEHLCGGRGHREQMLRIQIETRERAYRIGLAVPLAPLRRGLRMHILIYRPLELLRGHDLIAIRRADAAVIERIEPGRIHQRNVLRGPIERGQPVRHAEHHLRHRFQIRDTFFQRRFQLTQIFFRGEPGKPAGLDRYRMRHTATDLFHPLVADAMQLDDLLDHLKMGRNERDDRFHTEQVWRDEITDVQAVAFHLLRIVQQHAQLVALFGHRNAHRILDCLDRREGVRYRADSADTAYDGLDILVTSAEHHGLKKARRLRNLPFALKNPAVLSTHANIAVTFNAGNVMNADINRVTHWCAPACC